MMEQYAGKYGNKAYDANETRKVLLTRPDGNPAIFNVASADDLTYINNLIMNRGYKEGYNEEDHAYERILNQELNEARYQAQQRANDQKQKELTRKARAEAKRIVAEEFPDK